MIIGEKLCINLCSKKEKSYEITIISTKKKQRGFL